MKGETGLVTRKMVAEGDDAVLAACDLRFENFIKNVYLPELRKMQDQISSLRSYVSTLESACERHGIWVPKP